MFGKVHPALEGYTEPHDSALWLVKAFFRLHNHRSYAGMSGTPMPIKFQDTVIMADDILGLRGDVRRFFFEAVEEIDFHILDSLKKSASDDN